MHQIEIAGFQRGLEGLYGLPFKGDIGQIGHDLVGRPSHLIAPAQPCGQLVERLGDPFVVDIGDFALQLGVIRLFDIFLVADMRDQRDIGHGRQGAGVFVSDDGQ